MNTPGQNPETNGHTPPSDIARWLHMLIRGLHNSPVPPFDAEQPTQEYHGIEAVEEGSDLRTDVLRHYAGRRALNTMTAAWIVDRIEQNEPFVDASMIAGIHHTFTTTNRINAFENVIAIGAASPRLAALYGAETGIGEYRLHELTQAVLNRYDDEYRPAFSAEESSLVRLSLLMRNIAKPIISALHKPSAAQDVYTGHIIRRIVADVHALTEDEKQFITVLASNDYVGNAIRGSTSPDEARAGLEQLRVSCPERWRERFYSFVEAVYMSQATVYTSYGQYRDAAGFKQFCYPVFDHIFIRDATGQLGFNNERQQRIYTQVLGRTA